MQPISPACSSSKGPLHPDAELFFIVGRGLLNGLEPYADLFESKPPGVFLIAALSLLLTGGERLASVVQVALFAVLPIAFTVSAYRSSRRSSMDATLKTLIAVLAFTFGALLALYAEHRAGMLLAEGFGAMLGSVYVLTIPWHTEHFHWRSTVASALLLMLAVGMKEPFILAVLAAALLLCEDLKHFLRAFILPVLIAILCGALFLAVIGLLPPYLTIYLPHMITERIVVNIVDPPLMRGFALQRIASDLASSGGVLLAVLLGLLWSLSAALRSQKESTLSRRFSVAALLSGALAMSLLYFLMRVSLVRGVGGVLTRGSFLPLVALLIILAFVSVMTLWMLLLSERRMLVRTILAMAALYLLVLSVGIGGTYYDHHFAFAVPAFAALGILAIQALSSGHQRILTIAISALLIGATLEANVSAEHMQRLEGAISRNESETRATTERLDSLLDACDIDRYEAIDARFPFAHHSPVGPMIAAFTSLPRDHPFNRRTDGRVAKDAGVVLIPENVQPDDTLAAILERSFTREPPPCAEGSVPLEGFALFFRQ